MDKVYAVADECDTYTEDGVPVPEEVEESEEVEERAASISNAAVWESTELTSPIGEAWRVYPELQGA